MARMNHRSFTSATPLTENQIRQHAPSIFAVDAHFSRSERFAPIPTIEIVRGLAREGFQPFTVGQCISRDESRQNFTKHLVRFRKEGLAPVRGSHFEVVLVNGNDGSAAYRLEAGVFRMVCLNGMIVKSSELGSLKVRHTGDVMHKVIDGTYKVLSGAEQTLDATARWSAIELDNDFRQAFAVGAHAERFGMESNTPITPAQLLIPRRAQDTGRDLWSTFNVLQENTVRGGLTAVGRDSNGRPRRTTTREIAGIDQNVKVNSGLWEMAAFLERRLR